ncbi:MAG: kinesin domain-containing protein [Lentinula lateritia]|nr:MAG: kinesin domain-containing protein [Lentinula lateritia]
MAPSSSAATTSVQVALRIRPPTNQDSTSIPARFQRTVIHASSSNSVAVEATSSTPAAGGAAAAATSTTSGPGAKKQHFSFDQVHDPSTTQHTLFTSTALPLVSRFIEGFNCTILAYGQTSSGKTFTMTGIDLDANPSDPNNGMGIIPRAVSTIFTEARRLKEERGSSWNYSIKGSFIEIYNEDLIDLLSMDDGAGGRREVQIREDKDGHIIWGGLREVNVKNPNEVMTLIRKGTSIRRTNETDMNAQSSRSHAIFSLTFTQKKYSGMGAPPRSSSPLPPGGRSPSRLARPGSVYSGPGSGSTSGNRVGSPTFGRPATPSFAAAMGRGGGLRPSSALGHAGDRASVGGDDEGGEWTTIVSKFHFVDLAGSERLKRTAAAGERIKEGISINSGLLALGNVISALGDPSRAKSHTATHVPYRDSKLTRLLQDSLGGNAHTLMIACVSPAEWNAAETINTLKYANRARNIKNRAVVNEKEDGWDDVEWLQGTVTRLRKEVKTLKSGGSISSIDVAIPEPVEGAGKKVLAQMTELQNNYQDLRAKFVERTEELTRLRRELGEKHRGSSGAVSGTGKYEEIVGPVIEEYEKTIAAMEAELSLNRAALRHTNEMVEEKEEELAAMTERHSATELYIEELRSRLAKLSEREASTEAYVRDLEEKMRTFDETSISSSESMSDLKREIARYKEADTHSAKYITDLEARLSRSDESVLALQQTVERLEKESEQRQEEVQVLQTRLETLRQDGESWRNDLEQREAKVRELEIKMKEWEKKRQDAGDARVRLGSVVDEVAAARRNFEIDLSTPGSSPSKESSEEDAFSNAGPMLNGHSKGDSGISSPNSLESQATDPSLQKELIALQQTHNATLVDLSSVTTKYRDALREISDLAAQIQEAKLANATEPESVADTTDSERAPEKPVIKRRMTSGRLRETSETQYNTGGRRLFFRQAASTESLHSRSLSQSQSLSQELSSARSRKHSSSSHGTASSHSPTNSHSVSLSPRPNLSISLPNGLTNIVPAERSAVSLEKEIMRLQEVLKEREAEISTLEHSLLKATQTESSASSTSDQLRDLKLELDNDHDEPAPESFLSPQTINKFAHIRRSMQFHSENGNSQRDHDSNSASDSMLSDTDDSLDRLNELMLSMAQKESSHREIVDSLTKELNQTRRSLDELTTLSRDQALNMSTEVEALREKHQKDLQRLEEVQQRESELIETLAEAEVGHAAAIKELRKSHFDAMKQKQKELDNLLSRMSEEHEVALSTLGRELAAASSALKQALQSHEEAFGKLQQEHEEELQSKLQEASDTLSRVRQEHEGSLLKAADAHMEAIKQKDVEATASIQQTEEDYYNALTQMRSDHAEVLLRHTAESTAAIEKLKEEHAAEIRMSERAKESLLSESQSSRGLALQELQDEHSSAIFRKEVSHTEDLEKLKTDHARALLDKDKDAEIELGKLRAAIARKETIVNEELAKVKSDHIAALSSLQAEHATTLSSLQADHVAAISSIRDEHASILSSTHTEHVSALTSAKAEYVSQLDQLRAEHEEAVFKLKEEQKAEGERLTSALSSLENDSSAAAVEARNVIDAAVQSQREQQAALLAEITRSHADELEQLKAFYEQMSQDLVTTSEAKTATLLKSHTAEVLQLRTQHQQEITELRNTMVSIQEQHKESLENMRALSERNVAETTQSLQAKLNDLNRQHLKDSENLRKENELLMQELEAHKVAADEFLLRDQSRQIHEEQIAEKDNTIRTVEDRLSVVENERDGLASDLAKLKAEFERTRTEQSLLVQEASKRESLVMELERHRSVLAEMQENLQRVKDEKDTLQIEKGRSDSIVRELQAQIARSGSPPNGRPATERFNRIPGAAGIKLPPPTPPPSVPPPPAPRSIQHDPGFSASSAGTSSSSRDSQQIPESPATPATSLGGSIITSLPASAVTDTKALVKIDEQARQLEEQEAMIKTLNKQLTHCESDLQTHMDLVSTLETSLGDSEKNLRKARMHATELARERDRLNGDIEALRKDLTDTKREVVNVRQSIVEEKQSYEQRLDEERKAKERARQQLDSRMEELSKRKSKFACL